MESYTNYQYGSSWFGNRIVHYDTVNHQHSSTADYHAKVAAGVPLDPLPYYALRHQIWSPVFPYRSTWPQYSDTYRSWYGDIQYNNWMPHPNWASKLGDVITDHDLNLALVWLERSESLGTIKKRALQLALAARYTRKGKFAKAGRVLGLDTMSQRMKKRMKKRDRVQQFSENWLELHYAWTPLVFDMYNAAHLVKEGFDRNMKPRKFLKSIFRDQPSLGKGDLWWSTSIAPDKIPSLEAKAFERYTCCVYYSLVDPDYRAADALGLTNPALVLWEVVPYSFVVDWFIPIGDELRSWTQFKGWKFIKGYTNYKRHFDIKVFGTVDGSYEGLGNPGDLVAQFSWDQFQRSIPTSFDDLHKDPWNSPGGLSVRRTVSALTLLERLLRG